MIQISRMQRKQMEKLGLLHLKTIGKNAQDQNFTVVNRFGKSRKKKYYVTETPEILSYLQMFDQLNYQKITPAQLDILKGEGLVDETQIQLPKEYVPEAIVFVTSNSEIYCKKITNIMKTLGYWK